MSTARISDIRDYFHPLFGCARPWPQEVEASSGVFPLDDTTVVLLPPNFATTARGPPDHFRDQSIS
jgi:hypothetical protein